MNLKNPSRAATTLTLGMVLLVATTIFAQQLGTDQSKGQTTAKLVSDMVSRYHISQASIDDDISSKLLDRFLEELDPQKLYFLQSDIDEFNKYRTDLDDLVKVGKVDFAYKVYDLYLKRLDERIELAHKLIDAEHDFSIDESIVIDPEALTWAQNQEEIEERWRKRIKYDLLNLKIEGTPLKEVRERLHKRYHNVRNLAHQTEDFEKLETYLSSLTHSFDPHSSYMSAQTLEDFRISMELSLEGIGAALKSEDGYTVVAQIVPGGAAEKDGRLKVGDKIIGVDDGDGEMVDVVEMKLSRVVRYIRGESGTKVRLQVKNTKGKVKVYELTRQKIELKSAEVKGEIIESEDRIPGTTGRIGVINIPSFYRDFRGAQRGEKDFKSTARDVLKVLRDFRDQGGVDAIVIDLRTNGGGALSEAIEVSGLFIDQGPVVQVKEQDGDIKPHNDEEPGVAYSGPLLVVCNKLSASASEIFAGVIKDYGRGIVVGDQTTHGKGTVQNVMPVSSQMFQFLNPKDRGALKLTINKFYRVNGASTQSRGVKSDIVLPSLLNHMDLGEASLDNALPFDRIEPTEFSPVNMVNSDIISTLQQKSQQRVAEIPGFQDLQKEIEEYLVRKNRNTVPLNEEKLRKQREGDKNEEDEDEKVEDKLGQNGNGPVFPDEHYNNEVLQITLDYINLLKGLNTAQN